MPGILPLILVIILVGIALKIWPIDGNLKNLVYGLLAILVVFTLFNLVSSMSYNEWWCYPRCAR